MVPESKCFAQILVVRNNIAGVSEKENTNGLGAKGGFFLEKSLNFFVRKILSLQLLTISQSVKGTWTGMIGIDYYYQLKMCIEFSWKSLFPIATT